MALSRSLGCELMVRSRLLDKGRVEVLVYPEVTVVNNRGSHVRVASDTPVKVFATKSKDRSQTADVQGQIDTEIVRYTTRSAPLGPWSRVSIDGVEYDLAAPPHRSVGATKAVSHIEFLLRARSQLGVPRGG